MKGLLKKDLLLVAKGWPSMVLITVLIGVAMIWMKGGSGLVTFLTIYMMMQGITTLVSDKMSGWNELATNLPVSRAAAIREKYVVSVLLYALSFPVGLALTMWLADDQTSVLVSVLLSVVFAFSALAIGVPALVRLHRSYFFAGILASFIPAAVMVTVWSRSIEAVMTMTASGPVYTVDMATGLLGWMAAGSAAAALVSMLVMPKILSRYDQN